MKWNDAERKRKTGWRILYLSCKSAGCSETCRRRTSGGPFCLWASCGPFPGEEIIAPQRRIDWFAVVLEGRVQILNLFANGSSSLMDILKPSYVLGADLICTESRVSPYYAVADSPCRIFAFPSDVLLAEGALPDPIRARIWQRLITLLSHENMRKHYRLAILSQHGLRDRILVYLTMQAGKRQRQLPDPLLQG